MTWALKRQIFYVAVLVAFFGFFGFLIFYPVFNKPPTCTDGFQNGEEIGVDCGGSCIRACTSEAEAVSVIWARSFEVVPGRYNALVYLENHNKDLAVTKIHYQFRFADESNVYLGRREGTTTIPPGRPFAVFERGISLPNSVPVYTTFQFTEVPTWINVPEGRLDQLKVLTGDIVLENEDSSPHLRATIKNNSLFTIPNINLIAILYDENHNAVSASSATIDRIFGQAERQIDFTWPLPFLKKIVTKEVLPVFDIFEAKIN